MAPRDDPRLISLDLDDDDLSTSEDEVVPGVPMTVIYDSNKVEIPADFMTTEPHDARPVTLTVIDWKKTVLPENDQLYAVVLDNVLSQSECDQLLKLAESSVPTYLYSKNGTNPWRPALVNVGRGREVLEPDYRNSDRIIWDQQEIVDRLWERCLLAPGLREQLAVMENGSPVLGHMKKGATIKWEFRRLNKRMRFLKYGAGQFFRRKRSSPQRC
jgi:hypothetical protein